MQGVEDNRRSIFSGWLPGPPLYVLNRSTIPLVPLSLAHTVAKPWGDFAYAAWGSKANTVRRNYATMLDTTPDDARVASLARRCFRQFALYVAEMIDVQGWDSETVMDRLDVEGDKHFAAAEAAGRGIIFVSGHMGSTEIAASIVALRGYKITSVIDGRYPGFVMDWIHACRNRLGITLLPASRSGVSLIRRLRNREMVALVVDAGVTGGDGIAVEFFGRETVFPAGPARLARLSGAPIVFGLAVRKRGGRFHAFIEPPIHSDRTLKADDDARMITQQIASTFERYIRRYPDQWYVFRDMWPARVGV